MRIPSLLLACLLLVPAGCSFRPEVPGPGPQTTYLPQTSPENVLANLATSYRRREIDEYAKLLAHDFRFVFQPEDAREIATDTWNRDQDSTATGALFASARVRDIVVDLTYGDAVPSTDGSLPDAMHIRVSPTYLEVNYIDDLTLLVSGDIQDFFFHPGDPGYGENPEFWYVVEWRDLGDRGGVGKPGLGEEAEAVSWGRIRARAGR